MNRASAKNAQLVTIVKEKIILILVKLDTSVDVEQQRRKGLRPQSINMETDNVHKVIIAKLQLFFQNPALPALMGTL